SPAVNATFGTLSDNLFRTNRGASVLGGLRVRNGEVSYWWQSRGLPARRPPLPGSAEAGVCIVGAGYTGLWTAYYLKRADPGLRVIVLEAGFAGFGASGRNGGWGTATPPGSGRNLTPDGPGVTGPRSSGIWAQPSSPDDCRWRARSGPCTHRTAPGCSRLIWPPGWPRSLPALASCSTRGPR